MALAGPELEAAKASLRQQVSSGGITQGQMDNEIARLTGQPMPGQTAAPATGISPFLSQAKSSLDQQVASGGINQVQADNELRRLQGIESQSAPNYGSFPLNSASDAASAGAQIGKGNSIAGNILSNPNQYNPFGSSVTTIDPITGQPTVTQNLSQGNQQIMGGIQGSAVSASDALGGLINGGIFGSLSNPSQAGGPAPSSSFEDAVFNRLTNGFADQKAKDMEQLDQTLHNRGIPINSKLYNDQMAELNKRYDTQFANAKGQAVEQGTQLGLQSMGTLSSVAGQGFMNPNFQQFQATPFNGVDINSLFSTSQGSALGQSQLDLEKQKFDFTKSQAKGSGGGGSSGGGGGALKSSPFSSRPPGS